MIALCPGGVFILFCIGVLGVKLNIEGLGMEPGWNFSILLILTHTNILKISTVP